VVKLEYIVGLHSQEYQKALEDADEKVQLANQIYELVNRCLFFYCNSGRYSCAPTL